MCIFKRRLKLFEIWSEGGAATGEYCPPFLLGTELGTSFKDACKRYSEKHPGAVMKFRGSNVFGYWGKLFSNPRKAHQKHLRHLEILAKLELKERLEAQAKAHKEAKINERFKGLTVADYLKSEGIIEDANDYYYPEE